MVGLALRAGPSVLEHDSPMGIIAMKFLLPLLLLLPLSTLADDKNYDQCILDC